MKTSEIVGRDAELGAIDRFLQRLERGPVAITFEGHPGIGKTTVWRQVFGRAERRSFVALSCHPVEAEAKLAFASLADLFEPVADEILPQLPEPQRLALEVALMRATPQGAAPSPRAVATAVLSGLRLLAAASPVVLAVDDQQWLDHASAEALAFALRRIGALRVGIVATTRVEVEGVRDPMALDRAFAGNLQRMRLEPLTLSGLHHVLRSQLDHVFPRPTLRRIADTSGGNPFFALELARALIEADTHPVPGEPLPVPDTLSSLVQRRLDRLPARARAALLVASALSAPTVELVRQALGGDHADTAVAHGERARLIEARDGHISFAHPLFASAVYASASAEKRRETHRRLADITAAPEERARHLAMAAAQPDADVARVLDDASLLARRRGAPDAAGELQEQAAGLTPSDDVAESRRRRIQAAEYFFHAGARAHARELLEGVLAESVVGQPRAAALHLLGQICGQEDAFAEETRHLEEALTFCTDLRAKVAIRLDIAYITYRAGDRHRAITAGREALAEAERLGDQGLIACALAMLVAGEFMAGLGSDPARMARALALEDPERAGEVLLRPTAIAGMLAVYEGRVAEAETKLRGICDWAKERGEESGIPVLLFNLSRLAGLRGDLATASAYADEALLLAEQSGSDRTCVIALIHRSRARAMSGNVAGARADLAAARAIIEKAGFMLAIPWLLASEGLLELSLGDSGAAGRALEPLVAFAEINGIGEPMHAYYLPDAIEALVGLGEIARAQALLEPFSRRAHEFDRPWAMANATRCRSMLAAAKGDLDVALTTAEEAVARWEDLAMPIEVGRALITLGQARRRRGERRAAREAIERASAIFRDLGAPLWAERAGEELRRIPIRRAASKDEFTPTEEQVATLAAAGRTNREVAGALHMSPKTVEANLGRIYGKLGISSRAELGACMLERRRGTKEVKK